MFFGNAWTGVVHVDRNVLFSCTQIDVYAPSRSSKGGCVVEEVAERRLQKVRVPVHFNGLLRCWQSRESAEIWT